MIYETRGVAHGKHVPLLPMLALFRAYFGVQENESESVVRNKISARLLSLDDSLREDLPIFFDLLGVVGCTNSVPSCCRLKVFVQQPAKSISPTHPCVNWPDRRSRKNWLSRLC